ncbi:MAG: ATP-binding protein [Sumerlaeia bacterium]
MKNPAEHTLNTIWGHQAQIQLVRSMLKQDRLPHALLLHGADGVGKRSLAFALAKQIFTYGRPAPAVKLTDQQYSYEIPFPCFSPDDLFGGMDDLFGAEEPVEDEREIIPDEPDLFANDKLKVGTHSKSTQSSGLQKTPKMPAKQDSAQQILAKKKEAEKFQEVPNWDRTVDVHPRVHEQISRSYPLEYNGDFPLPCKYIDLNIIEPMDKSRSIKVDQIRYLQEIAWIAPMEGRYRVIVIFGADTITSGAANSLLKFLEEPPSYLKLILVTNNYHQVLETIRSRCAQLFCQPLERQELINRLISEENVERGLATILAGFSEGKVGTAINALKGKSIQQRQDLIDARLSLESMGLVHLPAVVERIMKSAESMDEAAQMLLCLVRDRLITQLLPQKKQLVINQDMIDRLQQAEGNTQELLREARRLIEVIYLREHPVLPASQLPLELAFWPE